MTTFNLETDLEKALEYMTANLYDFELLNQFEPTSEEYKHYSQCKHIPEILFKNFTEATLSEWIKFYIEVKEEESEFGIVEIKRPFKDVEEISQSLRDFLLSMIHLNLDKNGEEEARDFLFHNIHGCRVFFIGRSYKPVLGFFFDKAIKKNLDLIENVLEQFEKSVSVEVKFFTEQDRVFHSLSFQDIGLTNPKNIEQFLQGNVH